MEQHEWPTTAPDLMRSRFAAFKAGDEDWLLASWHPSTRPAQLELSDNPHWRGLRIIDTVRGLADDTDGIVEFKATYLEEGRIGVLHERSRFIRQEGRWFYVDGTVFDRPID